MCNCVNVEIGSYTNQAMYINPFNCKYVCLDKCIAPEICDLWDNGIETTGCCCGHNKARPMINVKERHHEDMVDLGYKFWVNEFGVKCYTPKSIKYACCADCKHFHFYPPQRDQPYPEYWCGKEYWNGLDAPNFLYGFIDCKDFTINK